MGKHWKQSQILFSWVSKSLQMVTATTKLKDSSPWKKGCEKHIQYIKKQRHYFANKGPYQFSSVQSLSHVRLLATPWTAAHQASVSITNNSWSLPKLMSFESVMPSNHLIFCHPHLLLLSTFPSIRVFSNESPLSIRWPKYWSFSFNISHSSEHLGLVSFRMDRLDLLAIQGTLKSLLQHDSSKAINSSALSFLYSPTLTSIHDYWTNHSLD